MQAIEEHDIEILRLLQDVTVEIDDQANYTLTFHFPPDNEFFVESTLTKRYTVSLDVKDDELVYVTVLRVPSDLVPQKVPVGVRRRLDSSLALMYIWVLGTRGQTMSIRRGAKLPGKLARTPPSTLSRKNNGRRPALTPARCGLCRNGWHRTLSSRSFLLPQFPRVGLTHSRN